jgi:hypothetical protein
MRQMMGEEEEMTPARGLNPIQIIGYIRHTHRTEKPQNGQAVTHTLSSHIHTYTPTGQTQGLQEGLCDLFTFSYCPVYFLKGSD